MNAPTTFTTATAAEHLRSIGISASTVKNYANHPLITPLLSEGAHPGPGRRRQFTADDLSVIAAIYRQVQEGASIEEAATAAAARARNGVVLEPADSYRQLPTDEGAGTVIESTITHADGPGATPPPEGTPQPATAAALALRTVYEVVDNRVTPLWERIIELERENAALRAELEIAHRPWWRRLRGK